MDEPRVSAEEVEKTAVFRWNNRRSLMKNFVDQHIPKYSREVFNVIGLQSDAEGVFEGDAAPEISALAYGFNVGGFRCKPGTGPALHRHETEEVFMVLEGEITCYWMNGDKREEISLGKYDIFSIPPGVFRAFYNSGDVETVVLAIVGGPDAGKVQWHPSVIQEARDAGLSVDDEGAFID